MSLHYFILFLWLAFPCIYEPHLYLFICRWIFRFLPSHRYCPTRVFGHFITEIFSGVLPAWSRAFWLIHINVARSKRKITVNYQGSWSTKLLSLFHLQYSPLLIVGNSLSTLFIPIGLEFLWVQSLYPEGKKNKDTWTSKSGLTSKMFQSLSSQPSL